MKQDCYIESLRRDIEDKFNHSFKSASDFDRLEALIKNHSDSHDTLNASTLKRIWGYSKSSSAPRRTTLTILAKVLGSRDWESYVEKKKVDEQIESGFIQNRVVNISDIVPGDTISFKWNPDRTILLRCIDNELFEVAKQENSSLRPGDRFRILYIREGYPLYCKNVIRNQSNLGDYIAGEKTGILDLKYQPKSE